MIADPEVSRRLGRIEEALVHIIGRLKTMSLDLARLEQTIAANGDVVASVVQLLQSVSAGVRDAGTSGPKLTELADKLDAQTAALAEAVAANTIASPTA
jgi:hypothetical protein